MEHERAQDHRAARGARAARRTASSTSASACRRASPRSPPRRGIIDLITLTAEPGVIGGVPAGGPRTSARRSTRRRSSTSRTSSTSTTAAASTSPFLGLAQADAQGNLNVSKFGPRLAGAGGFINISQNAKKVVFVGTFTAGGLRRRRSTDGGLRIAQRRQGAQVRCRGRAPHFSGAYAAKRGQQVLYVTERCVFELTPEAWS